MRYLLLIDAAGNVVLGDADTDVRIPIGEPLVAGQQSRVSSAVWSAAGEWTAWSVDSPSPDGIRELRLHNEETDEAWVLAESVTAFYMNPSPCGRWLSHLSPGPLGLELAISEIATGDLRIIERGQPLFWSWSPDSSRLAVHVENRVLIVEVQVGVGVDAEVGPGTRGLSSRLLSEDAGGFVAPWWLPGGSVAFAVGDRIVAVPADLVDDSGLDSSGPADSLSTLIGAGATGRFAPDPEGRRIAHIEDVGGHQLVVVDLLSGDQQVVTTSPVGAFFWSLDGSRLAALVAAPEGHVRWLVFDGSEVSSLPPFRPSRHWAGSVLPFFEQYAQSHSHWSPDGRQLVAPAVDDDGSGGALIQDAEPPHDRQWIPDAELVWWA